MKRVRALVAIGVLICFMCMDVYAEESSFGLHSRVGNATITAKYIQPDVPEFEMIIKTKDLKPRVVSNILEESHDYKVTTRLNGIQREMKKVIHTKKQWKPAMNIFGGGSTSPGESLYQLAYKTGKAVSQRKLRRRSGGGPGVMQASLEYTGSFDIAKNDTKQGVLINISSEKPNEYVQDSVRLLHFPPRKRAFFEKTYGTLILPGGIGTIDEVMECLLYEIPFALVEQEFWLPIMSALVTFLNAHGFSVKKKELYFTNSADKAIDYILSHEFSGLKTRKLAWSVDEISTPFRNVHALDAAWVCCAEGEATMEMRPFLQSLTSQGIATRVAHSDLIPAKGEMKGVELQGVLYFPRKSEDALQKSMEPYSEEVRYIVTNDLALYHALLNEKVRGYVFGPGGLLTVNNFFEVLDSMNCGLVDKKPVIVVGKEFRDFFDVVMSQGQTYYKRPLIWTNTFAFLHFVDTYDDALMLIDSFESKQEQPDADSDSFFKAA